MKVAAFQFRGCDDVKENLLAIERGIEKASKFNDTRVCMMWYPPVETDGISSIDFENAADAIESLTTWSEYLLMHFSYP